MIVDVQTEPRHMVQAHIMLASALVNACEDIPERAFLVEWCRRGIEEINFYEKALKRHMKARL